MRERSSSPSTQARRRCWPGCSDKRQTKGRRLSGHCWPVRIRWRASRDLKSARQAVYDRAHVTISSDGISVDEVAQEIEDIADTRAVQPLSVRLDAASGASDIRVGPGVISRIGEWVRESWPKARRSWIVTDGNVGPLHAEAVED